MSETAPREPYGRRPLPGRADWRRALGIYVSGRSRALTLDEKRQLGGGPEQRESEETSTAPGAAARPSKTAYGVGVPPVLDFYRNASTWRNRLPEPKSRGETTADA